MTISAQDTPIRLLLPDSVPQFEVPFSQALELAMLNSPDPTYYKLQNRQAESSLARAKANAGLTEKRAEHRYNVAMRLYLMGQTSLLGLNDAIAERNASRRSHISSMSTFWNLYYTLRSITGYDFQTRHPLTEQLPI